MAHKMRSVTLAWLERDGASVVSRRVRFDLELFKELNRKYAGRRSHQARANTRAADEERGFRRAKWLDRRFGLKGKRCLEVGSGRGDVVRAIAEHYGCQVVGVDVEQHAAWDAPLPSGAKLLLRDI